MLDYVRVSQDAAPEAVLVDGEKQRRREMNLIADADKSGISRLRRLAPGWQVFLPRLMFLPRFNAEQPQTLFHLVF
ncbi:hypothetical protein [Sodalis sp.]|uniref:hypothetical protein n=1 Tax=Sodalis sp. (in: enterobacteria) TaxID=1898979 RepID=UPI003872A98A